MANESSSGPKVQTQVGLGCGSLILIALIVWLVPNNKVDDLRHDVRSLSGRIFHLESKLDELLRRVEALGGEEKGK